MKIKYVGKSAVREISDERGRFVWASDVDYAVDVPASLAAELLTYPRPEFVPDISDPLCRLAGLVADVNGMPVEFGVGGVDKLRQIQEQLISRLAALALAGVGSLADLAGLNDKALKQAAQDAGIVPAALEKWRDAAKKELED